MDASVYFEILVPGDSLRLREDKLKHIRTRDWTFFRRISGNRLLLLHKGKPLSIHVSDIDWEKFQKGDFLPA